MYTEGLLFPSVQFRPKIHPTPQRRVTGNAVFEVPTAAVAGWGTGHYPLRIVPLRGMT